MKIVVKHVDNLKSSLKKGIVFPEYLVYLMTEDNTPIACNMVRGDEDKNKQIEQHQSEYNLKEELKLKESRSGVRNFTLPVEEVSYKEFRNDYIKTLKNEPEHA